MSFSEFFNKSRGAVKPIASVCCSLVVAALCGCSSDSERFNEWGWSNGASYRDRDRNRESSSPEGEQGQRDRDGYQQRRKPQAGGAPLNTESISSTETVSYGSMLAMMDGPGETSTAAVVVEQQAGHVNNAAAASGDSAAPKAKVRHKRRARRRHRAGADVSARQELPPPGAGGAGHVPEPAAGYNGRSPNLRYARPAAGGAQYDGGAVYVNEDRRGLNVYQGAPGYQGAPPYQGAPAYPAAYGYQIDPGYYGAPRRDYYEQPTGSNGRVHIVERGETLYSISRRYGVGIGELTALNRLNTTYLSVGQTLLIPEHYAGQGRPGPAAGGQPYYGQPYNDGRGYGGYAAAQPQPYGAPGYGNQGYGAQERDSRGYGPQDNGGQDYGRQNGGRQARGQRGYSPQAEASQPYPRQTYEPREPVGQPYGRQAPADQGYGGQGSNGQYRQYVAPGRPRYAAAQDNGRESYAYDRDNSADNRASSTRERDNPDRGVAADNRPTTYRQPARPRGRRPVKTAAVAGPDRSGGERAPADRSGAAERPVSDGASYTVKRGDTLYTISRRHGVRSKLLAEHNGIDPLDRLKVGQELRIPSPAGRSRDAGPDEASPAAKPRRRAEPAPAQAPTQTIRRERRHRVRDVRAAVTKEAPISDAPAPARKPGAMQEDNAASPATAPAPSRLADNGPELEAQPMTRAERDRSGDQPRESNAPPDEPAPRTAVLTSERPQPPATPAARSQAPAVPPASERPAPLAPTPVVASAQPAASPVKPGQAAVTTEALPAESGVPDTKECEALLEHPMARSSDRFREPVQGKIISEFGPNKDGTHNDGVNIMVPAGTIVKAAENGVVAYAGNELSGFGNLILIRHADGYVTAYAHNEKLLVKRCEVVKRGQPIAKSGSTGAAPRPQLHFEIRKDSKPVDPSQLIARM